jgi:DNA-binding LacI/PurR family transcriptional regulator
VTVEARLAPTTKHSTVAKTLREEIISGVWTSGEQLPSEQVIAKRFGVAYMTARQAVSSLVAEGILERIARKGTFVTQGRAPVTPSSRDRFVMLIEGGKTSLDPYYLPPILEAFEQEIRSYGSELTVYDYSMAILNGLIAKDALVCCVLLSEPEILYTNLLRERGNRVYAINQCNGGGGVPFVTPDNAGGAHAAVEHLIELGHRRIGFIRGLPGNIDAGDRRHGYLRAMLEHGLEPGPVDGDNFVEACGYEVAKRMLAASDPPTAIVCASDLSAVGAMKAVAEAGLSVPRDVSVVGFGDFPLAMFLHPGLTTVRLPLAELGKTAAREMMRLAQGETVEPLVLPCDLVVRDTTSAPCFTEAKV